MAKNVRQSNGNARRKLVARVKREGRECAICGQPIDLDLPPGHPGAFELDEIIPVSKGGSPIDYNNVQPTHRRCNQKKSNKVCFHLNDTPGQKKLVTSRNWREIGNGEYQEERKVD